jgi:TolB-like protein
LTRNDWRKLSFLVACFGFVFLVLSPPAQADEENPAAPGLMKRVAVVSFEALTAEEGSGNTVFCPICGVGSSSGKVQEGDAAVVEEIFLDRLNRLKGIEIIPSEKVQSVYKRISAEKFKGPLTQDMKRVGDEVGADFVAAGYVYRYVERVGYKYSSERPASVIFEIHLMNAADGSIIWRGFFDKTQKSLMEDVFQISSFFRGGAKWLTVRQLTEQGMDEVFKTFPDFQR